jgi:hypothetical protein
LDNNSFNLPLKGLLRKPFVLSLGELLPSSSMTCKECGWGVQPKHIVHDELGGGASRSVVNGDIYNNNSAQGRVLK